MPVFDHYINALSDIVVHRFICDAATADRLIADRLTHLMERKHIDADSTMRSWRFVRGRNPTGAHFTFNVLGQTITIRNERLTAAQLEAAIISAGPDAVTAVQKRLMPTEPLAYPQRVIIAFTGPCDEPDAA